MSDNEKEFAEDLQLISIGPARRYTVGVAAYGHGKALRFSGSELPGLRGLPAVRVDFEDGAVALWVAANGLEYVYRRAVRELTAEERARAGRSGLVLAGPGDVAGVAERSAAADRLKNGPH